MTDRSSIEQAIAALESQRAILGDAVVEASLAALRTQLAALQPPPDEQRKLATILFADVSGFTALSETRDAEEITAIMNALWERLDAVVLRHGGRIDKHIGDALMALWGADQAQENDPEQAVRAALLMQAELAAFREERKLQLAMRIGLNTGPVLLGSVGTTREFTAMGDTVNLASRLEHVAPVGGVLISHDTYQHVRGLFDVELQEPIAVKGKREPIQTYIVRAAKARAFQMPTRGVEGIATRMIGREVELLALQNGYHDAVEGRETRMVTVVGDAGVGKSRLLSELLHWVELLPNSTWLLCARAIPEWRNQPGALLRDMLSARCNIREDDPIAAVREKLTSGLSPALDSNEATILGHAVGFDAGDVPAVQAAIGSAGFTNMATAYLATYLRTLTRIYPVLIVLEDLHWADDRSLNLLDVALAAATNLPLLVIGNTRHTLFERRPDWGAGQAHSLQLDLRPLSSRAVRVLVHEILQRVAEIPEELYDLIITHAEGNPFYLEELIKMLIDRGVILRGKADEPWRIQTSRLQVVTVPTTLTGVLQARLDSLPAEERATLQRASIIGRAFWDTAVAALAIESRPRDVRIPLENLRSRELVFRRERSAFIDTQEYVFKHALLRDVTYETVLKRQRRDYHRQAAIWLEQVAGDRANEYAALIADHYAQAEDLSREGIWQARAGQQAAMQYAYNEALPRLGRALLLLPLEEQVTRYSALCAREGIYNLRGERELQAADLRLLEELATVMDDTERQVDVALRWSWYAETVGDYSAAVVSAQRAFNLAVGDMGRQAAARQRRGLALWWQNDLAGAQEQAESALVLARSAGDMQSECKALALLGRVAEYQGKISTASTLQEQALGLAREIGDRHSEAVILADLAILADLDGDLRKMRLCQEGALKVSRAIGDQQEESAALGGLGLLAAYQGDFLTAYQYFEQSYRILSAIGVPREEAAALTSLGYLAADQGDYPTAQTSVQKAMTILRSIGDKRDETSALNALGLIAANLGDFPAARTLYEQGFALSRLLDDQDGMATILNNLGLLSMMQGDILAARQFLEESLASAYFIGFRQAKIRARANLGHVLADLAEWGRSSDVFLEAIRLSELNYPILLAESRAGLARTLSRQGNLTAAQEQVDLVLHHLATNTLYGAEAPMRAYLCCYDVLQSTGESRAQELLKRAHQELTMSTTRLDHATRQTFLENVPWNRAIVAAWEGLHQ